jgi:hypothetical protein
MTRTNLAQPAGPVHVLRKVREGFLVPKNVRCYNRFHPSLLVRSGGADLPGDTPRAASGTGGFQHYLMGEGLTPHERDLWDPL